MKLLRFIGLAGALLAAQTPRAHDFPHAAGVDLKHLPLGDTRLATGPRQGWIWPCRAGEDRGRGAGRAGPWIKGDGTYDLTEKPQVSGQVMWPHKFTMSVEGARRVFTANDLPNHPTGVFPIQPSDEAYTYDRNPNGIRAQDMRVALPMEPVAAASPGCTPGAVGILLTGVVLFNALDAEGRDAVAHETQDSCQGHPQVSGTYHYHSLTTCYDDKQLANGHSVLAGYALDGFGIYGRYGEGGKILTSVDLDACHGHVHAVDWNGKTVPMYHYHGTWDFPYTVGCMRGTYDMRDVMTISGGPALPPPGGPRRGPPPGGPPPGMGGPPPDPNARPPLETVAQRLGISLQQLRDAVGPPPPDFKAGAAKLGITEEQLREAFAAAGLGPRR